jgi:CDP-diacylglycerol--serine O-phosphatidyltransferase
MVTNLPFYSFKDINFRKAVPFWAVLAVVAGITVVASKPAMFLFLMFLGYVLSGYVLGILRRRRA